MVKIEYSQPFGMSTESTISGINFSNALNDFVGHSLLICKKLEQEQFREFMILKDKWVEDILFVSSGNEIISNGAYKKIITKGVTVLPWIFRDLAKSSNHWFFALEQITGENPINPNNVGEIEKMKNDWLQWAKSKNIYED